MASNNPNNGDAKMTNDNSNLTTEVTIQDLQHQLTMKFIAGRRPTAADMIVVEQLREELSTRLHEQRQDISWCKS